MADRGSIGIILMSLSALNFLVWTRVASWKEEFTLIDITYTCTTEVEHCDTVRNTVDFVTIDTSGIPDTEGEHVHHTVTYTLHGWYRGEDVYLAVDESLCEQVSKLQIGRTYRITTNGSNIITDIQEC